MTFLRMHFYRDVFYTPTHEATLWPLIFFLSSFLISIIYGVIPNSAIDKGVILSMSDF